MSTHILCFCPVDNVVREDMSDYNPEWLELVSGPGYLQQHEVKDPNLLEGHYTLYDTLYCWGYEAGPRWDDISFISRTDFVNLSGLPITEDSIKAFLKAYMLAMAFQKPGSYLPGPELEKLFEQHLGETFYVWF